MAFPTNIHIVYTLVDNSDDVLAAHPNTLSFEINAIETKLGIDSSAVVTTIDYFLKHTSGAYRNHVHDATSDDGANIPATSTNFIKTGDLLLSTVTTARTGWTNVSATYSNKFMRINATPLTTGGTDTHTHTVSGHTHATDIPGDSGWNTSAGADSGYITTFVSDHTTSSSAMKSPRTLTSTFDGTNNTGSGNNVPAYVQVVAFQKD